MVGIIAARTEGAEWRVLRWWSGDSLWQKNASRGQLALGSGSGSGVGRAEMLTSRAHLAQRRATLASDVLHPTSRVGLVRVLHHVGLAGLGAGPWHGVGIGPCTCCLEHKP